MGIVVIILIIIGLLYITDTDACSLTTDMLHIVHSKIPHNYLLWIRRDAVKKKCQ